MSIFNVLGYKTMSLKQIQKSKPKIDLKKSQQSQVDEEITMNTNQTYCVGLVDTAGKNSKPKIGVECSTGQLISFDVLNSRKSIHLSVFNSILLGIGSSNRTSFEYILGYSR